jgi:c-di-GMP-binding flagellar brake protein YcgR
MELSNENRRKFERYDLQFPATIQVTGEERPLKLYTRDISANGAFLCTAYPLKQGLKVSIEIIIENETLKKLTGHESCIKISGIVIRCEQEGMAVTFEGHEKIMPLRSMMDN